MEVDKIIKIKNVINIFNLEENIGQEFMTHAEACLKISDIMNQ